MVEEKPLRHNFCELEVQLNEFQKYRSTRAASSPTATPVFVKTGSGLHTQLVGYKMRSVFFFYSSRRRHTILVSSPQGRRNCEIRQARSRLPRIAYSTN